MRSKHDSLPFPDKHFDLVVLNEIQIKRQDGPSKKKILEYMNEIKRVLNTNGCLCAGLQNKHGLKVLQKKTEEETDYESYLDSFSGYNSLFNSLGFQVDPYWVLLSHSEPHYSGKIGDDVSLKWFFQNFDKKFSVDTKFRIAGIFLKLLNSPTRKLALEFCPSFLFYCYKGKKPKVLEDLIMENTGFEHLIQNARLNKILYILLDKSGNPRKAVSCQRTKYDLTEKVFPIKRIFPKMGNTDEKIVIEEWFEGEVLDRLNVNDLKLAMKWLTDFQNNTMSELLSKQEIEEEVTNVKNELDSIEEMDCLPYDKWLDEYKEVLSNIKLKKTAVHGDFQVRNILINRKKSLINVIDWDWRYQEKGNPLYDFMWLATNIMMISNDSIDEFRSNLDDNGKAATAKRIIKETMKNHFRVNLDFIKLQRFMILRFITIRIKYGDDGHLYYIKILKILS
jgi:thiamine kinase-like enzyme